MKKILTIITTLALLTSLTACSGGNKTGGDPTSANQGSGTSTDQSTDISSNTSSDTSSDVPDPVSSKESGSSDPVTGNEIAARFEAPDGKPVDLTGAVVTAMDDNGSSVNITVEEMTEDNWFEVRIPDTVYLAESTGIYYDSVKNADIYDADEMTFAGAPEKAERETKKYKVGDSFGDLKITHAVTSFTNEPYNPLKYFNGGELKFDGTLNLSGKLRVSPKDEVYVIKRDIFFLPTGDDCKKLPIMDYYASGNVNKWSFGDQTILCDLEMIRLGNADDYSDLDFSKVPEDGKLVDVKITIGEISFRNYLNFTSNYTAKLIDIEIL